MSKIAFILLSIAAIVQLHSCARVDVAGEAQTETNHNPDSMKKWTPLDAFEKYVIIDKGTERPHTGLYADFFESGTYHCKQCGAPLFRSESKFRSECGWPSFDDALEGAVIRVPDADGERTEIVCARCGGHLGHVFEGEGFTAKDTRHCVNSVSMTFTPDIRNDSSTAIFAGGCFWGVEYYFQNAKGVISTQVGYTGGHTKDPTYEQVCRGQTGHYEAVKVTYDPEKTNYEELARLFFEIHDPSQTDGQGNDIGQQYHSVIFYSNDEEKSTAFKLIEILKSEGYRVATQVRPVEKFWPAESYHQEYYAKNGGQPYCHSRVNRFPDK